MRGYASRLEFRPGTSNFTDALNKRAEKRLRSDPTCAETHFKHPLGELHGIGGMAGRGSKLQHSIAHHGLKLVKQRLTVLESNRVLEPQMDPRLANC